MAGQIEAQDIFNTINHVAPLGLIVSEGARELGAKINKHLVEWAAGSGQARESFIVESECPRFSSGDGKGIIPRRPFPGPQAAHPGG